MMFTFELRDSPKGLTAPLTAPLTLVLMGKVADNTNLIICTINGQTRYARWDEFGWTVHLDRPVALHFGQGFFRIVHQFEARDLPDSAVAAFEILHNAGIEAAIGLCNLCGTFVPYQVLSAYSICACPECRRLLHPKPADEPPF